MIRVGRSAVVLGVLGLAACGADDTAWRGEEPGEAEREQVGQSPSVLREALRNPDAPSWQEAAPDLFQVRFETSEGDFEVEVHRDWAPLGADRFYNLVRHGYFDDSRFFRVVEGFIAQFGIPGDPAVTTAWTGRTLTDDPVVASNIRGRLAYAMTGPDTRHTQIYINLVDNVRLDSTGFAPFAEVTSGMDVVDRLYSGYGENAGGGVRRGNQRRMLTEGNAHLDADFPQLDRIVRARILERRP
jgi:homoserine O-acetyltransferase